MILGIILLIPAIIFMCWLLFNMAVYALPFFAGITAGMWAYDTGAGAIGAIVVGFVAAIAVFVIGQLVFSLARPLWIRVIVAILFAAPATMAGFYTTRGLAGLLMPSETWQMIFSVIGAIAVGITALYRLAGAGMDEPYAEHPDSV